MRALPTLLVVLTSLFVSPAAVLAAAEFKTPSLHALQKGGLVIFLRHAISDRSQNDASNGSADDCATQRNLSQQGRAQAVRIGQAIKDLGIPIAEVLSSPYCRCRDTAQLAFGSAKMKVQEFLHFAIGLSKQGRMQAADALRALLSAKVAPGGNRVIVSHNSNLREAAAIWPKPEGVAYVFRPLGDGFEVVGRIAPDQWRQLEQGL
ncbi:histidine phosphatase family protein [Magnetofaba australis]|uniref:Putative Phosphoglycerate mutase n=1 Tax=Magnetofaba australis IT-1 TaxID=1434232 RepID=A0A1Y2K192_9PROT|nr:histidine phosphatase family protein [Magnetofaba australis]OSM01447.1 putative Phosphoglycerate mutase [Magnetofaba australis IT-1]